MLPTTSFVTLLAATGAMAAAVVPRTEQTEQVEQVEQTEQVEELGCVQPSLNFEKWTIVDFDFHWTRQFSTPSHAITNGFVDFNITSPALSRPLKCSGHSTVWPNFFRGDQWFDCEGTIVTSARFAYDNLANTLKINQGWLCDTSTYNHTGSGAVNLKCVEGPTVENKDWAPNTNQILSEQKYTCEKATFDIFSDTPHAAPITGPVTSPVADASE